MNYGQVVGVVFFTIGSMLAWQGLWLLCRALWPRRVRKCAQRCEWNRWASFGLGLPVSAVVVRISMVMITHAHAPGRAAGWVAAFVFLMYAATGMSGLVTFVGERLGSPADTLQPWLATVRGGAVLEFASLFPVIGWFVLFPCAIVIGAGAMTLSFFGPSWKNGNDLQAVLARNREAGGTTSAAELPELHPADLNAQTTA